MRVSHLPPTLKIYHFVEHVLNWIELIMWHGARTWKRRFSNYEIEELCWEHSGEQSCVENTVAKRVELRTKFRREKNIEHYELRGSIELRTLGLILCMNLFCVCCSCNLFSLLIYVLQKLQRAELFSNFLIPQDTQFISTILGENEQCFPNSARTVVQCISAGQFTGSMTIDQLLLLSKGLQDKKFAQSTHCRPPKIHWNLNYTQPTMMEKWCND